MQILADSSLLTLGSGQNFSFQNPALADVADDAGEQAPISFAHLADGQVDGEDRSILAPALQLPADTDDFRHARRQIIGQKLVGLIIVWRRHQHGEIAAQDLIAPVMEHVFRGLVEGEHTPLFVDRNDPLGGDESLRIHFGLLFAEHGYRVVTASGGLECLNRLCQAAPEVLILDKELLWGGAEGVLAVLRGSGSTIWPPVVLLTQDRSDELHQAQSAPVVACLRKPVDFVMLLEKVGAVLSSPQHAGGTAAQGSKRPKRVEVPSCFS
jgi:CheY-like chemotaxis protein